MGWRFRRSFKVIPGVRLNLSKNGLSCSIGGAPFTANIGPRGVYGTISLPGSGISYRKQLVGSETHDPSGSTPPHLLTPDMPGVMLPIPPSIPSSSNAAVEEIRSASTELLTSESLKELKRVIQTAYEEHEDISRELDTARLEKQRATDRYQSWNDGFLLKRIFKVNFAQRKVVLDTAAAKVSELEEQLHLTTVATHVEIEKEQAEPYFKMRDEFCGLAECAAIWDVRARQATDKFRERTTADTRLDRERIALSLSSCDLIQWEQKVPHLPNANGGELFLYPGFILYRAAREAFSVIDYHDLKGTVLAVKFQEQNGVPTDSKVVGQTWAKANKDGSRDKRFVDNYQIPIALYGSMSFKSTSGLWEEFHFSDPERLRRFAEALNGFSKSFGTQSHAATQT